MKTLANNPVLEQIFAKLNEENENNVLGRDTSLENSSRSSDSLLEPNTVSSFAKQKIVEIMTPMTYSSHAIHESMYKQLLSYIGSIKKNQVSTDDFYEAFKIENIKEDNNNLYQIAIMNGHSYRKAITDFVLNFIQHLESLRKQSGNAAIGLLRSTSDKVAYALLNAQTFNNMSEMVRSIKISADKIKALRSVKSKENQSKADKEFNRIKKLIEESMKPERFSTEDLIRLSNAFDFYNNFPRGIKTALQKGYEAMGYEEIIKGSLRSHHTIVKKIGGKYSMYKKSTLELEMTDIDEYRTKTIADENDKTNWIGVMEVRVGDVRRTFQDGKEVSQTT